MNYLQRQKQKLIRRPDVILQEEDDEVFLLDERKKRYTRFKSSWRWCVEVA